MADYNSSLPVRTESAGDIIVKVADATVPSQQLTVESDGSINTNASIVAGSKVQLTDGVEDVLVSTSGELQVKDDDAIALLTTIDADTSNLDVALSTRATEATALVIAGDTTSIDSKLVDGNDIGDVTINNAAGASAVNIQDGGNSITVDAIDLDIRDLTAVSDSVAAHILDENGNPFTNANPLPVSIEESAGDEVCDYQTSSSLASAASTNHDYTVTAAKTLLIQSAWVSGSSKLKAVVQVNGATKYVGFNSTANPNIEIPMNKILKAAATQVVRITITNLDNQAQDVYSTLLGVEV